MAKSILTPEGDLINYDNLIAVSVEVRSVGVDDEHTEDAYCIVGTDVTNRENLLYHSLRCRPQTKAVMPDVFGL